MTYVRQRTLEREKACSQAVFAASLWNNPGESIMKTVKLAVLISALFATGFVHAQQTPPAKAPTQTAQAPGAPAKPAPTGTEGAASTGAASVTTGTIAGVPTVAVIGVAAAVVGVAAINSSTKH